MNRKIKEAVENFIATKRPALPTSTTRPYSPPPQRPPRQCHRQPPSPPQPPQPQRPPRHCHRQPRLTTTATIHMPPTFTITITNHNHIHWTHRLRRAPVYTDRQRVLPSTGPARRFFQKNPDTIPPVDATTRRTQNTVISQTFTFILNHMC
ncbi:hypothetical protein OS493_028173 [Desmophyllum pertusum]|uniref:Uncharacterized protein n=1 Tax=Desmophyllum pertusum TaxID=174260 RepID=A0A9W9YX67_9CNID|nr:hypothetical protein OS493_028173 [Desmophyllum pertusum]